MAEFLHLRPEIIAGCVLALIVILGVIRRHTRLYAPPFSCDCNAFKPQPDGTFRCKDCGRVVDDAGDLPS